MKKMTLQAIAEAANVSCATVSRCLSGREGVGEKTRQRILQLCREMGYHSNFLDASPQRSGCIGLLCPRLSDPVTAMLAEKLEVFLSQRGYSLLVAQSGGNRQQEAEALQRLIARGIDGVIIIPATKESRKLLRSVQPAPEGVFLNAHLGDQPESYVAVDHFLGGQAAVRYLHEQGHRRILFVGNEESEISNKRRGGAVSAFRQLRLEGQCADIRALEQVDWSGYTAVIAADRAAARRVPPAMTAVGFDGETFLRDGPSVPTFDTPDTMAAVAAGILLEKLERPVGGYSHRMVVPQLHTHETESEVSRRG